MSFSTKVGLMLRFKDIGVKQQDFAVAVPELSPLRPALSPLYLLFLPNGLDDDVWGPLDLAGLLRHPVHELPPLRPIVSDRARGRTGLAHCRGPRRRRL